MRCAVLDGGGAGGTGAAALRTPVRPPPMLPSSVPVRSTSACSGLVRDGPSVLPALAPQRLASEGGMSSWSFRLDSSAGAHGGPADRPEAVFALTGRAGTLLYMAPEGKARVGAEGGAGSELGGR